MEVTELLQRYHAGDRAALDALIPMVYGELKDLAKSKLRKERRDCPLNATALVHEAFLRLHASRQPEYANRVHFYGIASRVMRQVLTDLARTLRAQKRDNGREIALANLDEFGGGPPDAFLDLHLALENLAQLSPQWAQFVEMRFFGGMSPEDIAEYLSVSIHKVRRDLRLAQAWLRRELSCREQ
jgi:RNA polymerase sigma factor (TIGR02999 family)